jgi:hypothetical protein
MLDRFSLRYKLLGFISIVVLVGLGAPARAAGPTKGPLATDVTFQCTVVLVAFPSPGKIANPAPCAGTATGVFAGSQTTAPGGAVVGLAANGALAATVNYSEPCVGGGIGFSNGVATSAVFRVVNVDKALFGILGPGVYTAPYSWTRVGMVALIMTGKLTPATDPLKPVGNATLAWATGAAFDGVGGIGLGLFIPLGVPGAGCPGPPLAAMIVGRVTGL